MASVATPSTLFDKVWDDHVVESFDEGWALLHIDRHLLHDLSGPSALVELRGRGLPVREPDGVFATADHLIASDAGRTVATNELGGAMWAELARRADSEGIRTLEGPDQGIVHVVGPELGIVVPGLTVVCGDSHTCTNGALGALAFGIGSSQITQALAAGVLLQERPRQLRITVEGDLGPGVTAKDLALAIIGTLGASAGASHAIEYAGSTIAAMDMEARMTLCNLTVELGAKFGMIAPDETTLEWVAGRRYAPTGADLAAAADAWAELRTDEGAIFDREVVIDAATIEPMVTWGTSPAHTLAITGQVPDPEAGGEENREGWDDALAYMGLEPGQPLAGTPVDWVFIGSCANSRLSDLRVAADIVRGHQIAPTVSAWVVPGSEAVRAAAEAEGLHDVFITAGFEWRRPGCSMCVAANGDRVPPGARCVSTSNRNFVGRQGPGSRTHLASPATAAAAAIAGAIVDPRTLAEA